MNLKKLLPYLVVIAVSLCNGFILSTQNFQMYGLELFSDDNGLEYYYTGQDFWKDLSHMKEDYAKCYNNNLGEKIHFGLRNPEDIHNCESVRCTDFSYSSKLLAEAYGYSCEYQRTLEHSFIRCVIDGEWRIVT